MRAPLLLLLLTSAAAKNRVPSQLDRLKAVDDWINHDGGPPRHWKVTTPKALKSEPEILVVSGQKEVNASKVKIDGRVVDVVVKAQRMHT